MRKHPLMLCLVQAFLFDAGCVAVVFVVCVVVVIVAVFVFVGSFVVMFDYSGVSR